MRNVQVDETGTLHCWNCGGSAFAERRTARSVWMAVLIGIVTLGLWMIVFFLFTKKKLRCHACGEYNDVGTADPYQPPDNPAPANQPPPPQPPPPSG